LIEIQEYMSWHVFALLLSLEEAYLED